MDWQIFLLAAEIHPSRLIKLFVHNESLLRGISSEQLNWETRELLVLLKVSAKHLI